MLVSEDFLRCVGFIYKGSPSGGGNSRDTSLNSDSRSAGFVERPRRSSLSFGSSEISVVSPQQHNPPAWEFR